MKVLFVHKLGSTLEQATFDSLSQWINDLSVHESDTCRGGEQSPYATPDVIVHTHGHSSPMMLQEMGITNTPKAVCYMLGKPRHTNTGMSAWGEEYEEFNDAIWSYGWFDDVETEVLTIEYAPLPIDVEAIDERNPVTGVKFCRMASGTNYVGRMWHKTLIAKKALLSLGKSITTIADVSHQDALNALKDHNVYIGNFRDGNLGKSELEAMTCGLACFGWLRSETRTMYEGLGATFPYVHVDKSNFKTLIQTYTKAMVETNGADSRAWMLANYSHQKLVDFWVNKLEAL